MPRKKIKRRPIVHAPQFVTVTARLYAEDVARLKADAAAAGEFGWQPRLRTLVHNALRARKEIR